MADRKFEKSFITPSRLPVSREYVRLGGRGRLFALGGIGALVVTAIFLAAAFGGRPGAISGGELSASHALFADDCSACHTPGQGVQDAKCQACHERLSGPTATYGFDRHYLYQSRDFDRSAPSSREGSCAGCHQEHDGRRASLLPVDDANCQSCHEVDSFGSDHPDFAFAANDEPDAANLRFPHVMHVRTVLEERELPDLEAACLQCHEPGPDGAGFQPISFERHCDECHIRSSTATGFLPIAGAGGGPGVRTLETIRREGGPGTGWAAYMSTSEFQEGGGQVRKRPVYHEDPWILHNLQLLRRELYPGAELADLLRTSAEVPPTDAQRLHREAVAELRSRIRALRGQPSPDVQEELEGLETLLALIERRLADPYAPVDETRFDVSVAHRSEDAAANEEAYASVIEGLTSQCSDCHVIDRATIRRVQTDQRTLVRAEFDHRAHVIHARCLDCHATIPVEEFVSTTDDPDEAVDNAAIQNLPSIATCRQCHSSSAGASVECTSCHVFHPDKARGASLSAYAHPQP